MSNYTQILDFGENSQINNPLTYCTRINMNHKFLHGSSSNNYGQYSVHCNNFMSDYCAEKWDSFCETASRDNKKDGCNLLTEGEKLIKESAEKKYTKNIKGFKKIQKPFDPNVASSPLINYWVLKKDNSRLYDENVDYDKVIYHININTIDSDKLLNKLINKPYIAPKVIIGLYKSLKESNNLEKISGTKLGKFYKKNFEVFKKL